MIDAAKLDEIERTIRRSATISRAANATSAASTIRLPAEDADALLSAAREAITLRALIKTHNDLMSDGCWIDPPQPAVCSACRAGETQCPRRHLIDLSTIDAAPPAQGGETTR